jgi:hypothetical protein
VKGSEQDEMRHIRKLATGVWCCERKQGVV